MKNFIFGFTIAIILILAIMIPIFWPPELSLVFNNLFWIAIAEFITCAALIWYLFKYHGSISRGLHLYFGIMLIFSSAIMFSGSDQVTANALLLKNAHNLSWPLLFVLLDPFISLTKNIVSFGFAAIGANLAASAILNHTIKLRT